MEKLYPVTDEVRFQHFSDSNQLGTKRSSLRNTLIVVITITIVTTTTLVIQYLRNRSTRLNDERQYH